MLCCISLIQHRKKKSKSKDKAKAASPEEERVKALERAIKEDEATAASPSGSGRNSPAVASGSSSSDRKTAAERRFEEVQKKRVRSWWFVSRPCGSEPLVARRQGGKVGTQEP